MKMINVSLDYNAFSDPQGRHRISIRSIIFCTNFVGIEFSVKLNDINKFEKLTNISINAFNIETTLKNGKFISEVVRSHYFTNSKRSPTVIFF